MAEFDAKDARQEIMNGVKNIRDTFESQVEMMGELAKLYFARYEALIQAGFNDVQALEIVKARGISV